MPSLNLWTEDSVAVLPHADIASMAGIIKYRLCFITAISLKIKKN